MKITYTKTNVIQITLHPEYNKALLYDEQYNRSYFVSLKHAWRIMRQLAKIAKVSNSGKNFYHYTWNVEKTVEIFDND